MSSYLQSEISFFFLEKFIRKPNDNWAFFIPLPLNYRVWISVKKISRFSGNKIIALLIFFALISKSRSPLTQSD